MKSPRFGLLAQLLTGFAAVGGLVTILLIAGNMMLEKSAERLVTTLDQHVRPLARLQTLQSRFGALRIQELELGHTEDVFALQSEVTRLRSDIAAMDIEINKFSEVLRKVAPAEAVRLEGHWRDYRARLSEQTRMAAEMNLAGVRGITAAGSYIPFMAIQAVLTEVAARTEVDAAEAYQTAIEEQARQRPHFLWLVAFGGMLIFAGLAFSGQTVVSRIGALREHAQKLAAGEESGQIAVARYDEIGDLAQVFEIMRQQVLSREAALRGAQAALEQRVEERTTDLRRMNRRLVRFAQIVEQNPVGIVVARIGGTVEFANSAYARITGLPVEGLIGRPLIDVLHTADPLDADNALQVATGGAVWEVEQPSRRGSDAYWERLRLVAVLDERGQATHLLLSREDITEQRQQMEKITYQAHYDILTSLPNRVLANDRLLQAVSRSRRDGGKVATMFIDLDHFKEVNDTLGHAVGDSLLRQVAQRLVESVRSDDVVARLGGDEFLVVAGSLDHGDEAAAIAEKIIAAFSAPFVVGERELVTSPSIGVALYPDDGTEPMVLLRNADLAMYEAKDSGRNMYRFYNRSIHDLSLQRLEVGRCLRGALERQELHVVYHPLVRADSGAIVGAEALLRWTSPELGAVEPSTFIPVAEQNGLIVDLGRWVLREACATLARWRLDQIGFVMAVNVSPRQFRSSGFVAMVKDCLDEFRVPPHQLEIEITEGLLLRNQGEVKLILEELHALGVRLSMDDFGTGYSSLSYLREFPFHTVKIDRSFIHDVSEDPNDRALVVAAVRMAQALGLQIIAEGVETDEQWSFLAAQDCDILQGFRFGFPVTESNFGKTWVNARVPRPEGDRPTRSMPFIPV
ncbi:MAG: EAL domain-containing protein [Betaproteobacteria bacterium]|nr:EAL domain-containing protein [Betaproteobacteria bacterium]